MIAEHNCYINYTFMYMCILAADVFFFGLIICHPVFIAQDRFVHVWHFI